MMLSSILSTRVPSQDTRTDFSRAADAAGAEVPIVFQRVVFPLLDFNALIRGHGSPTTGTSDHLSHLQKATLTQIEVSVGAATR